MQAQFVEFAPRTRLAIMERSGSFAHIEEPAAVFETLRRFWRDAA
jgi:proline iminopeptidase